MIDSPTFKKPIEDVGEVLHVAELPGGTPVMVVPKSGYRKKYAVIGVRYGSIDIDFKSSLSKKLVKSPAGVAHFLEHKLFEKADGDVSDRLAELGCSTNAMTGFNHTGYLIECTENFDECLEILIDFVTTPYFTQELVDKEKGIIAEEIKMYRDDAGWRGFTAVLENLYRKHPVAQDIAGTLESIEEIDRDTLELCHRSFYRPDNLHIAVVGDVDVDDVVSVANRAMAPLLAQEPISCEARVPKPARTLARRKSQEKMSSSSPKLFLAYRIDRDEATSPMDLEVAFDLFLGALFGKSGSIYRACAEANLIDDSFSFAVYAETEFCFVMFNADTPDPAALEKLIRSELARAIEEGLAKDLLRRRRRKIYGDYVRGFDSVESIAWNLVECHAKGACYFDYGRSVRKFSDDRVLEIIRSHLADDRASSHVIWPLQEA